MANNTGGGGTVVHRRVEITVEREVVSLLYQPGVNLVGRCEQCGQDVAMLHADAAAALAGTTPREIYRLLDRNRIHFQETAAGNVLICSESLRTLEAEEPGKGLAAPQ